MAVAYGLGLFRSQVQQPVQVNSPTAEPLIPTATTMALDPTAPLAATGQPPASRTPSVEPSGTIEAASPLPNPTLTPVAIDATATKALVEVPVVESTSLPMPVEEPGPGSLSLRQRMGVVAPQADTGRYDVGTLGSGWYLTGGTELEPLKPGGMDFAQLVQVEGSEFAPPPERLREIAGQNPGGLWLVGNEPDVIWQDNSSPQEYARVYHQVYSTIKSVDQAAQIAIGGVSQATPLRLRYLEAVLAAYEEIYGQPMPVDVWNIHLAILREERGSWGVDIPPGLSDETGMLYEIQDNADVQILKEQVATFRRWMAERGLRDRPLIVTEFSVLMPADYGFPLERVQDFMLAAFDFFVSATDEKSGYPADGNRLVQRWAWYSVADRVYSTGNLFDPETGQITPLGRTFAQYAAGQ